MSVGTPSISLKTTFTAATIWLGGGFFAGKAWGLKLGLGLGGLGGPIVMAALVGAGSYALYRSIKRHK
ncbi:MAG: hypothetical protein HQM07_05595 [Zetaproteobacteria bacterium]|nr:hypothetical protein [Zetaproteobacteria bacterium]